MKIIIFCYFFKRVSAPFIYLLFRHHLFLKWTFDLGHWEIPDSSSWETLDSNRWETLDSSPGKLSIPVTGYPKIPAAGKLSIQPQGNSLFHPRVNSRLQPLGISRCDSHLRVNFLVQVASASLVAFDACLMISK